MTLNMKLMHIVSKEGNGNLKKEKSEGKIKAASGKVGKNVK